MFFVDAPRTKLKLVGVPTSKVTVAPIIGVPSSYNNVPLTVYTSSIYQPYQVVGLVSASVLSYWYAFIISLETTNNLSSGQLKKALSPTVIKEVVFSIINEAKLVQPLKAPSPIDVTLSGRVILVKFVQSLKASFSIEVTVSSIYISTILLVSFTR